MHNNNKKTQHNKNSSFLVVVVINNKVFYYEIMIVINNNNNTPRKSLQNSSTTSGDIEIFLLRPGAIHCCVHLYQVRSLYMVSHINLPPAARARCLRPLNLTARPRVKYT